MDISWTVAVTIRLSDYMEMCLNDNDRAAAVMFAASIRFAGASTIR